MLDNPSDELVNHIYESVTRYAQSRCRQRTRKSIKSYSGVVLPFQSVMKWAKCLCRAVALLVTSAPASFPRTVQPVTYSYTASNDGEYTETFQDGVHRTYERQMEYPGEHSTTVHPSVLTHHYYDRPADNGYGVSRYQPLADTTTTTEAPVVTIASQPRRARKKHEHVAKVSYVRSPESVSFATTISDVRPSAEPPMRKVLVRTRARPLRPTDEIPVEESTTESLPSSYRYSNQSHDHIMVQSPVEVYKKVKMSKEHSVGVPVRTVVSRRRKLKQVNNATSSASTESSSTEKSNQASGFPNVDDQIRNDEREVSKASENQGWRDVPRVSLRTTESVDTSRVTTERTRHGGRSRTAGTSAPDIPKIGTAAPRSSARWRDTVSKPSYAPPYSDRPPISTTTIRQQHSAHSRRTPIRKAPDAPEIKVKEQASTDQGKEAVITTPEPIYKQLQTSKRPRIEASRPVDSAILGARIRVHTPKAESSNHSNYTVKSATTTQAISTAEPAEEEDESETDSGHHDLLKQNPDPADIAEEVDYPEEYEDPEEEEAQSENVEYPTKILQKPLQYAYTPDLKQSASDQKSGDSGGVKESGQKSKSSHRESDGSKEAKGYSAHHVHDNAKKGHSDKTGRSKVLHEEAGHKKKHDEDAGHYKEHHIEAKGEKEAEYKETGKHKKGHSTKGKELHGFNLAPRNKAHFCTPASPKLWPRKSEIFEAS